MLDVATIKAAAGWLSSHLPPWQAVAASGAALAGLVGVAVLIRILRPARPATVPSSAAPTAGGGTNAARTIGSLQRGLTLLLVALGLGFDLQGNYAAFTRIHSMNPETRNVLFAYLPLLMVVFAVGARRNYLSTPPGEKPSLGFEGQVMWGIGITSALFAATAFTDFTDLVARLLIPPITAGVLKRLIKGEYAAMHGLNTNQLKGMFSSAWEALKRKLIRWGWMSAEHSSLQDEERNRRVMKLAPLAYRMHMLLAEVAEPVNEAKLSEAQIKARNERIEASNAAKAEWIKEINKPANSWLMKDPEAIAQMQRQLAGMYQSIADTAPKAVERMNPWKATTSAAPTPTPTGEAAEDAAIEKARKTVSAAVSVAPKQKAKPAIGKKALIREHVRKVVTEERRIPEESECDRVANSQRYAKDCMYGFLTEICDELGISPHDLQQQKKTKQLKVVKAS